MNTSNEKSDTLEKGRAYLSKALKVVDGVMDVVPTVVTAAASSNPVAWCVAGASVLRKAVTSLPREKKEHPPAMWSGCCRAARESILTAMEELFTPDEVIAGVEFFGPGYDEAKVYRYKDVFWANGGSGRLYGPYGDEDALADAFWDRFDIYELSTDGELSGMSMSRYDNILPPKVTLDNTNRVLALKEAGLPVGVHLNGTYGSGKTHAAHYMATALGGRTIRISVGDFSPQYIRDILAAMKVRSAILDDVDRGSTSSLLALCDEVINDKKIAVIGTSNNRKKIDSAFERAGRVDIRYTYGAIEPDTLEHMCEVNDASNEMKEKLRAYTVATVAGFFDKLAVWGDEYTFKWLATQSTHAESAKECDDVGIEANEDSDLIDEDPK